MRRLLTLVAVGMFAGLALAALTPFNLSSAGENGGVAKPLPWPQFRGPAGSGVADGQKPPIEFGPDKNVQWRIPVPSGMSSPIIVGNKLLITALDAGKLYTIAYNRADGKEAWRAQAPAKKIEPYHKIEGSPAASTPATDGRRIVVYFGSCGLFCYDLSGKELWKFELPTVSTMGNFGSGVSPLLVDDTVLLVRDTSKDSRILAIDTATGKLKWEKKRQSPASYGTPVLWDTPSGKQVVASGHGRLIAYDLATGDEKWSVAGMPCACVSSPVATGNSLIFAGWSPAGADQSFKMPSFDTLLKQLDKNGDGAISREEAAKSELKDYFDSQDPSVDSKLTRDAYEAMLKLLSEGQNSAFAVKAGGMGDVSKSHVLWKKTKGLPYVASAIVYRGQCVMVKDGGLVTAYDVKTGKDVYVQERVAAEGRYYASPVAANGHIYLTSLEKGVVTVLKAGLDKPEVVAKNPELGERVSATPAIAGDTLYVRTAAHLYAFTAGDKAAPTSKSIIGRWDLTVHGSEGDYPSWLEVRRSGSRTLVGSFVGQFGSARPISRVEFDNGQVRFVLPPQFERRVEDLFFDGKLEDGVLRGQTTDDKGKPVRWEGRRSPSLKRSGPPKWGEPIDLFDGKDLVGWKPRLATAKNGWLVKDGTLVNAKPGNDLLTERKFTDFKLHAEFRYPPKSNSGIYLRGRYEVQIEDDYGGEPDSHRIGGVYGFLTPSVNAAKRAGEWQSMDITLVGRQVTVVFNGERIIDRQAIPGITGGALDSDEGKPGPILLQGDHGSVEFRKVTLTPAK